MQESLKVVLVQTALVWENPEKNRESLSRKLKSLKDDVDVIILPEMFTTGFTMSPENHTFTLAGEDKKYVAGHKKIIETYKGFKFCPLICYDLRFPVWSRNIENYDILLYVANWPKPRIEAWDTLLKARAIENMIYCIGVNRIGEDDIGHEYPGHSSVYDALGKQVAFSDQEELIEVTLYKNHLRKTQHALRFLDDKDNFNLLD